jgi:hypothetical protein
VSRNQRLSFLGIAAVIAVIAIVVLAGGGGDDKPAQTATPARATESATATGTATAAATATPKPAVPVLRAGQVKRIEVKEGDTVRFAVRSDGAEEVHVHGYDLKKDIEPGKPVTFSFKATITGIFEVEFEHSGEQIAELRVEPK